jgi:ectoine hydroxylase-related dioxygenase (phytanoyl-CoA dioxygenase family)
MFTDNEVAAYQRDGWAVARGLFNAEEVASLRDHYMDLRARGSYPGDTAGVDATSADPLKRFPRMIHMHRWDETSLKWMLEPRLADCMTQLLGVEPVAVQTMLYFKPPGARGQALHQDQFYLHARPGTCMAAWMALDDCDEENGCLQVVPESGDLPILCTRRADTTQSFTDVTVELPEGVEAVPIRLAAGDVLFFNGSVIHGSLPNRTEDRFRRALIGHYVTALTEEVSQFYMPALRMDGTEAPVSTAQGGGACGVWTEADGRRVIEMAAR